MKAKLFAFAALMVTTAAAWGCTASSEQDDAAESGEDELSLFGRGNVDHAAIVEGTTMMLAGGPTDGILDPYNREDPFAIRGGSFSPTFARRLSQFDRYDGRTDWKPEQAAAWAARMSSGNYQVIDTSKPCDWQNPHTYLEIERAKLTGKEHTTCGGRMPNEDALDVTLNFLVRGPAASATDPEALHDRVDSATKPATDQFPYMAEMNGF
jgi:hypothetical protein